MEEDGFNRRYNRSKPISASHVESEIVRITEDMEKETEAFELLATDHAKKEAQYKKEWFKELEAMGVMASRLHLLEVDNDCDFIDQWPEGFFRERLNEL